MMCGLYSTYRFIVRYWYWWAAGLCSLALLLEVLGFVNLDKLAVSLNFDVSKLEWNVGAAQEALVGTKQWLGAAIWWIGVLSIITRLLWQPVLDGFVWLTARGHIVLSGLDTGSEQLVKKLRELKRNVLVLEPNLEHPQLESCRNAGAVCIKGSATDKVALKRAQLKRAQGLIVLGDDDRSNILALSSVASLLPRANKRRRLWRKSADRRKEFKCIIEAKEPGLIDVLRKPPSKHQLDVGIFNVQEMTARAMLRETMLGTTTPKLGKFLVVGTGRQGRMADALVIRAIKDHYLERPDVALEIHVFDEKAEEWAQCVTERARHLYNFHAITPFECPASRSGFGPMPGWKEFSGENYDAIFICVADESLAILQASRVADKLGEANRKMLESDPNSIQAREAADKLANTQIIVCVQEEKSGFGPILSESNGRIANVHVVGTHNRIFDVISSMDSENELIAQALHQDYLARTQSEIEHRRKKCQDDARLFERNKRERAFHPWTQLKEIYRQSNRELARRLDNLLKIPNEHGHTVRQYEKEFAPNEEIHPRAHYNPNNEEVERLAIREHQAWVSDREAAGEWGPGSKRKGPPDKYNDETVR